MYSNIDRILSLYQVLWNENYMKCECAKEELKPFRKPNGGNSESSKYYTSEDNFVKNYWEPGFAVPGTQEAKKHEELKKVVAEYITDTYNW